MLKHGEGEVEVTFMQTNFKIRASARGKEGSYSKEGEQE